MCDQATLEAWGVQAGGLGGNLRWEIQQDLILLLGCMATDYQSLKSSFDLQDTVETQKIDIQRVFMPPRRFSCAAFDTKCIQPTDFFFKTQIGVQIFREELPTITWGQQQQPPWESLNGFGRWVSQWAWAACVCHVIPLSLVMRWFGIGTLAVAIATVSWRCNLIYLPELGWYRFPSRRPVP